MKKLCLILSAIFLIQILLMAGCAVNNQSDSLPPESSDAGSSLEGSVSNQESLKPDDSTADTQATDDAFESSESTEASELTESDATETTESIPDETEAVETAPPETEPPVTEPPATEPPATEPPATEPPATEPPPTYPPEYYEEMIGSLYTRGQLLNMENNLKGFGPGRGSNGSRPGGAVNAQNAYGQYGANFIAEDTNVVYLTFDCGYEFNNLTADILDTLKEKNVKAVFFVTMYYVVKNPHLVQRMIDEGHIVGNHSNNHYSMPTLDVDTMAYEITSLHEYVKANFGYEMFLFRPPKGEYSTRSLALTQSLGYETVHWSFAYRDWTTDAQPDPAESLSLITGCAHNGAIYLLHAVSATNAYVLGDVIDNLIQQGYSIELFGA